MPHESIFASKSEVGKRYLTKRGCPIEVVQMGVQWFGTPAILVKDLLKCDLVKVFADDLLYPYDAQKINKEAITMAKASKEAKAGGHSVRGGERGARREKDAIILFRKLKGIMHEVEYKDGALTYRTKKYTSLKDVAEDIRGKKVSGTGRSFFGLRTNGSIELGREVVKGLSAAKTEEVKKVKKAKAKKEVDEDEEAPVKKTHNEPAAMSARGRR